MSLVSLFVFFFVARRVKVDASHVTDLSHSYTVGITRRWCVVAFPFAPRPRIFLSVSIEFRVKVNEEYKNRRLSHNQ